MIPLKEILRQNCFHIPSNQRGYSWSSEHAAALLDDLRLMGSQSHYVGPLIVSSTNEVIFDSLTRDRITKLILDDGQQRLTTALIFINRLIWRFKQLGAEGSQHYLDLRSCLVYYTGETNEENLRLSNANSELEQYLRHLLLGTEKSKTSTAPMAALEKVNEYFRKICSRWDLEEATDWKLRLLASAKFIVVNLTAEGIDRHLAFDAINARGLPLSEFDKIKNFCALVENRRGNLLLEAEKRWYEAIELLDRFRVSSRVHETQFISEAYSVFFNQKIGLDVHAEFSGRFHKLIESPNTQLEEQLTRFVEFWPEFAKAYGFVSCPIRKSIDRALSGPEGNYWLTQIDRLGLTTVFRPALCTALLRYSKEDFAAFCRIAEIYTFRVHGLALRRVDKNKNGINTLAHRIAFSECTIKESEGYVCHWIERIGGMKECFRFLSNGDPKYPYSSRFKGWIYCYYLLYQYELSLVPEDGHEVLWRKNRFEQSEVIEHILPQRHRESDYWEKIWPSETEADAYTHRLGNLVLSEGNAIMGVKPYYLKRSDADAAYSYETEQATQSEQRLARRYSNRRWSKIEILKRERELIDFALKRWGMKCCGDNGSYRLPRAFNEVLYPEEMVFTIDFRGCLESLELPNERLLPAEFEDEDTRQEAGTGDSLLELDDEAFQI